jgi:predicted nucleic acid-binding protein
VRRKRRQGVVRGRNDVVILVDTSVWIGHLRGREPALAAELNAGRVLMHPFVLGELACGTLRNRRELLGLFRGLPASPVATDDEAMLYIERHSLMGRGIGWIDVHLLAAAALAGTAQLWTRDGRLAAVASELSLAHRHS